VSAQSASAGTRRETNTGRSVAGRHRRGSRISRQPGHEVSGTRAP
jgi:hypothetical protein